MGLEGSWGFPDMTNIVPTGSVGNILLRHYRQTAALAEASYERAVNCLALDEYKPPGVYAQLLVHGEVMMDDSPMERHTHVEALDKARGRVLIGGLGLGMVVCGMSLKPEVKHITVLEYNPHVIDFVGPQIERYASLHGTTVDIVHANVFEYEDTTTYDCIWMDIWPKRSPRNLQEMAELNARYLLAEDGWRGCWYEGELKDAVAQTQKDLVKVATELGLNPVLFTETFRRDVEEADELVRKSSNGLKVMKLGDYGRIDLISLGERTAQEIIADFFAPGAIDPEAELQSQKASLKAKAESVGLELSKTMDAVKKA